MKILIFIFTFILLNGKSYIKAQNQVSYSIDAHAGFIMVHRYNMRHLVQSHIWGCELSVGQTHFDTSFYNHVYNFPEKGFSIYYTNLGNPQQLGNVVAAIPFMLMPLNSNRMLMFKAGVGLGYFNTTYHQTENNLNNVISSHLTVAVNTQFQKNWKLSNRIVLYNKIGMTHFSNAAYKMPNLGINLVTASLGLNFFSESTPNFERKKIEFEKANKNYFEFGLSSGLKEVGGPGGLKYVIFNANGAFIYPISFKSEFLLWGDFFHDRSLEIRLANDNWKKASSSDFLQSGILGGYRIRYNKLSFMIGMGTYIYTPYKGLGVIYHRVGIRYQINKKLSLNTTLKSHFAIADFAEWGIVYRIK
ncbi:MAG: acyloxyacyl hydrolase [Bacteroidia bacterium]